LAYLDEYPQFYRQTEYACLLPSWTNFISVESQMTLMKDLWFFTILK